MKFNLPTPPAGYSGEYFRTAFSTLEKVQMQNVSRVEAVDGVLLQAPNGTVWRVSVNNSGGLTTTSVSLGQTGAPPY
jgi:hypothetical protein